MALVDEAAIILQSAVNLALDDKFDESIKRLNDLKPMENLMTQALFQSGIIHTEMNHVSRAIRDFRAALALAPDNPDVCWAIAVTDLHRGRFIEAGEHLEARWKSKKFNSASLTTKKPLWTKSGGYNSVLVWPEQGIGDQILLCSILWPLRQITPNITVMADARLIPLFKRSMPWAEFVPQNIVVRGVESHIPMGSLVTAFSRSRPENVFTTADQYLVADRVGGTHLQEMRQPGQRLVGISWVSNAHAIGHHKSTTLEDLLPLLRMEDVQYVSLQYGNSYEEIYRLEQEHGIRVMVSADFNPTIDLDGLASLISMCDAVVTVSNATGHLAGGLGVPTYLLDSGKLWCWSNNRGNRNLWYPSVKIYRKGFSTAPWDIPVRDVVRDLGRQFSVGKTRPVFVFFKTGTEGDLQVTRMFVDSLKESNPDAHIIMCTDAITPTIRGISRFEMEYEGDRDDYMSHRLQAFSTLGWKNPAMYLDDDMIVRFEIFPETITEKRAAFCTRFFGREKLMGSEIRGLHFPDLVGKLSGEVFPFHACATVTRDHTVWDELLDILNHSDPVYRKWYGDIMAIARWTKASGDYNYDSLPEEEYGCLPEEIHGRSPKIIHFKGQSRKLKMKEWST